MGTLVKFGRWLLPLGAAAVVALALGGIGRAIYSTITTRRAARTEAACKTARQQKNWPELERQARAWIERDPGNALARLYLGEAAQRQGNWQLTADCLAAVPDDDPRCVPSLLELLELQLSRLENPVAATKTCERLLQHNPRESLAHQRLVFIYSMTLQRQQLREAILRAAAAHCLTTEMVVYRATLSSLRFSNGVSVNTKWLGTVPNSEVLEVARAVQLGAMSQGSASTFLSETQLQPGDQSLIESCLKKYPQNVEVLSYFLDKAGEQGDYNRVAALLDQAPTTAEQDSRFWRSKGWLHLGREELGEALEAYKQAIATDPYDWRARHQYATVLRRLGQSVAEIEPQTQLALEGKTLERALFELPTAEEIPPQLGVTLIKYATGIGDTDLAEAMRASFQWEKQLQLPPPAKD